MGAKVFFYSCTHFSTQGQVQHCSVKLVNEVVHSSGELGARFNRLELDVTSQSADCVLGLLSLCNNLDSYYVLLKEPQGEVLKLCGF